MVAPPLPGRRFRVAGIKAQRWECQKCGKGDDLDISTSEPYAVAMRRLDMAHRDASPLCLGRAGEITRTGEAVFAGDFMICDRSSVASENRWVYAPKR